MDITNTIGYYLRPNPTDTAAQAPYLPKLVPNGVANLNDVARKIAESLPVSEERAKLIIRESFTESVAAALLGYTVDMGALRMKARIPGSMPCEDTPFDPEANACVIELYADDELSGAFTALKPVKLTAAQLANAIKVSNVMDVETERFGEIHGTDEFMILGNGVTLDATGESAKIVDRKTGAELATAEVVSVSKGQRATCKLNPVEGGIAKGQYWLVVTTFGLIGETTPRVFRKPVTLVEAVPAPPGPQFDGDITSTDSEGHSVPGKFDPNGHVGVAIPGERLASDGETKLVLEVRRDGETAITKDVSDMLDELLDPDGTQVFFEGDQLYGLMMADEFFMTNGDVMTATFTNALGSTTATGEVYNLP